MILMTVDYRDIDNLLCLSISYSAWNTMCTVHPQQADHSVHSIMELLN